MGPGLMKSDSAALNPIPAFVVRVLWSGVLLLVIVGVVASVGRSYYRADFATRADPVRQRVLTALHREDPFQSGRAAELDRFDGRFATNPLMTLLHILPGGLILIFAPLQFSSRFRSRYIQWHRWSGRVLALTGFAAAGTGLYFGVLMPYGGAGEVTAIVFFGGVFVVALGRAIVAIRRHQVARHREWMIRAFAVAIGISTVRVVSAVLDILLTPKGLPPQDLFVLSLWMGWAMTLGAGELWIKYTRGTLVRLR